MSVCILGISAYYHDSAACLVRDGEIVAAAQEERFTRKKHDAAFPQQRGRVLPPRRRASASQELDYVGFYDKPLLKFERILENYLGVAPRGLRSFLHGDAGLAEGEALHRDASAASSAATTGELLFAEHHESHAASAFYPSPFEEAAVLTMDGVGEWATASIGVGRGQRPRAARASCTTRTRSACSTRRSPTTPASR